MLRLAFVLPNRNRDKKFANGNAAYDPNVVTYEDKTDLENLHFRYLGELVIDVILLVDATLTS